MAKGDKGIDESPIFVLKDTWQVLEIFHGLVANRADGPTLFGDVHGISSHVLEAILKGQGTLLENLKALTLKADYKQIKFRLQLGCPFLFLAKPGKPRPRGTAQASVPRNVAPMLWSRDSPLV